MQISSSETSATDERKGVTHGDPGKEKQHSGERPRKYVGKEKKARRLCLLVESDTKETAKYIHQFKNEREAAGGLKKAYKHRRE